MKRQVSAELLKLRTTRSPAVATLIASAFAALVPTLASLDPEQFGVAPLSTSSLTDMLRAPGHIAAGAALLVGILAATGEHSHHTVITTRLVEPDARRVLAAKVAAVVVAGCLLGSVAEATAATAGAIGLSSNNVPLVPMGAEAPLAALTVILASGVAGALGVALGTLLRNTAAAVATALLWVFAVENAIPVLLGTGEAPAWLPGQVLDAMLANSDHLPAPAAAALLAAYALTLLTVAMVTDRRGVT